jgi:hypothetical protein
MLAQGIDLLREEAGIATRLRAGSSGFDSQQWQEIFLFSTSSRPTMGLTQPPIQWVPWALSPQVKRQGREADHSPPSSAEVKNGGATPPLPYMPYLTALDRTQSKMCEPEFPRRKL